MDKNKLYRLGMYEKSMPASLTWKEKLETCKNTGFDWLEISIDESDEKLSRLQWDIKKRNVLKKAMIETGIPIHTMCLSGHRKYPMGDPDKKIEQKSLDIMKQAIDLAQDLGVRIIQLAGYDVYYKKGNDDTRDRFKTNLKKAVEWAAQAGVLLGFETMETAFMDTVEKSMEYVDLINSAYLQIYPDIGNLTNASLLYHVPVVDDLKKGTGHIVAAHLKETVPGKYREIPFGTGHTDFIKDITCLKDLGVRMFTGEFWYTGQEDWKNICANSAKFLRSKLDYVFEK